MRTLDKLVELTFALTEWQKLMVAFCAGMAFTLLLFIAVFIVTGIIR